VIIFTGTGRSGTGLYAKLFDAHHEYNVRFLTEYFHGQPCPTDPFADFDLRLSLMSAHLSRVDFATFRDSSNPYVHFLDALYALDPDVRIVLGVRDGRDFVASGVTRGYHDPDKYPLFSMIPTQDDPYYDKWPAMSPLERCAWMWTYRNQKALDRFSSVPTAHKRIVRLEDLRHRPTLKALETFAGVRAKRRFLYRNVNANKRAAYPPKEEWDSEMHQPFNTIAGNMMTRFGYELSH